MTKKITTNNSNIEKKNTKTRSEYFDEYRDMVTWRMKPVTSQWLDNMANELYSWAKDNAKAYKISQFYIEKGIGANDYYRWCKINKNLADAHAAALTLLGNRREIGALEKKLSENIVLQSLPMYDTQWKEFTEWRASLRKDQDNTNETKIVVIEKFPDVMSALDQQKEPEVSEVDPETVAKKIRKHTSESKLTGIRR